MDFSKITNIFRKKKNSPDFSYAPEDLNMPDFPELPDLDNGTFSGLENLETDSYLSDIEETKKTDNKKDKTANKKEDRFELPPLPPLPDSILHYKEANTIKEAKKEKPFMQELPELPDFDEKPKQPAQKTIFPFIRPKPTFLGRMKETMPATKSPAVEPHIIMREGGAVFANVNDFAEINSSIKSTRNLAKRMDEDASALIENEIKKDKAYEKIYGIVEDTQRKLMFIDKTLFEGGG